MNLFDEIKFSTFLIFVLMKISVDVFIEQSLIHLEIHQIIFLVVN